MTDAPNRTLVQPFPRPGRALQAVFDQLQDLAEEASFGVRVDAERASQPRPWDPATVTDPSQRMELWTWLAQVVDWLNAEYAWDVDNLVPACWPLHPHLVHEIAVLTDQRRLAGTAYTSEPMAVWHQITLPGFWDRMREQVRAHCQDGHEAWPARARHQRQTSIQAWQSRNDILLGDIKSFRDQDRPVGGPRVPHLSVARRPDPESS